MEINALQYDKLKEITNIGIGQAAGILNSLINSRVKLEVPYVKLISESDFSTEFDGFDKAQLSIVNMEFSGNLDGVSKLFFTKDNALKLTAIFTGQNLLDDDANALFEATFIEIGNIVLNSLLGSICNMLGVRVMFKIPSYSEETLSKMFELDKRKDRVILLAKTKVTIENLEIYGDFLLFLKFDSLDKILSLIDKFGE